MVPGIERDRHFIAHLQLRFPDLRFYHGSAEDASTILHEHGITKVRAVVSGLPFASLPKSVQDGIMDSLRSLMQPGTSFRTFQYAHAFFLPQAVRFRKMMDEEFGKHERHALIVRNLPPAYVLAWTK